jgi:Fic family protein
LFKADRAKLAAAGDRSSSAHRLHEYLQLNPFVTAQRAAERIGLSLPTVIKALDQLDALGILKETTGRKRSKVYVYQAYMDILSEGAQAPPRSEGGVTP